jgi:hypothetical protein
MAKRFLWLSQEVFEILKLGLGTSISSGWL